MPHRYVNLQVTVQSKEGTASEEGALFAHLVLFAQLISGRTSVNN